MCIFCENQEKTADITAYQYKKLQLSTFIRRDVESCRKIQFLRTQSSASSNHCAAVSFIYLGSLFLIVVISHIAMP